MEGSAHGRISLDNPLLGPAPACWTPRKIAVAQWGAHPTSVRNPSERSDQHTMRLSAASVVLVAAALVFQANALKNMHLQYTWGAIRFAFESEQQREQLMARDDFAPENSTIFDVDVDEESDRVFVTLPAFFPGYPATLATIKDRAQRDSPELRPYPDWSWHLGQRGCDGLTSVFRIYIDECRRLWVIDSGAVDIGGSFQHKCPAQLLLFDLRSDRLLLRHRLRVPPAFADATLMLAVLAETSACGRDAYAYVADSGSFALYVFSLRDRRSWRVESDAFRPEPDASEFRVDGSNFTVEDGVLGLAQDRKYLYFHAFSSFREGRVPKSLLRNERLFTGSSNASAEQFRFIGRRAYQSAGEAMSADRVMFFAEMGTNSIFCWNSETPYEARNLNVVEHDDELLHFIASVKMKRSRFWEEEEVWAVDNNGQHLFDGSFRPNQPHTVNIVKGSSTRLASECRRIWILP